MSLKINKWIGRFGNNTIQLYHCIQVGLLKEFNFIKIPDNKNYNKNYIELRKNKIINNRILIDRKNNFFHTNKFFKKHKHIANNYKDVFNYNTNAINILRELINYDINNIKKLGEDDLVIHLRGGDIFEGKGKHRSYICPPLSFYVNIIENNNFNNIYIVSQDRKNPVVDCLIKIYPKIKFKIQSFEEDIRIILSAQNLIESFGTFVPAIMLLSNNIKIIYRSHNQNNFLKNRLPYDKFPLKINIINLKKYTNRMKFWKNVKWRKDLMINYNLSENFKEKIN
jgi:hypothetical protein